MSDAIKVIKVFLASPGDLHEERKLVKEVEGELNDVVASYLGYRIEVKGWEDTLPGAGRPQSIINRDLDSSDLFIGMMWRRWGTPPQADGLYTSGFEEEFTRAIGRHEKTGKPDIALYFKKIDESLLADPGMDLSKVIDFKKKVADDRKVLYQEFSDSNELQRYVRKKIEKYLTDLKSSEEGSLNAQQSRTKEAEGDSRSINDERTKSPFSKAGHNFLLEFIKKAEKDSKAENITPFDIARFRLLASTISKQGNNDPYLGVHDANIVYFNNDADFGIREISRLIDCGLENIDEENTPLWGWLKAYQQETKEDILPFKSLSNREHAVGAIKAMKVIGTPIPDISEKLSRDLFIKDWISEASSNEKKQAALGYLKKYGITDDLAIIQEEFNLSEPKTSRAALEALVAINMRYNKISAAEIAYENQFQTFDPTLLKQILGIAPQLDRETLLLGIKHENNAIRLSSFIELARQNIANRNVVNTLKDDRDIAVRKEVVTYLLNNEPDIGDDEVKDILIRKNRGYGLRAKAISSLVDYDDEGNHAYDEYLIDKYCQKSEDELLREVEDDIVLNQAPYFALCTRYFKSNSWRIRNDIDDCFKDRFKRAVEYYQELTQTSIAENLIRLEDSFRKELTQKAIDILCQKNNREDLHRIRTTFRSGYINGSELAIRYFGKHGEWDDIEHIANAKKPHLAHGGLLGIALNNPSLTKSVAETILAIGGKRVDELFRLDLSHEVKSEIIKRCKESQFSKISRRTINLLINDNNERVRKLTSMRLIKSHGKNDISQYLDEYINSESTKYYNVIYWLDFGRSIQTHEVKKYVNEIISDE